jgi:hydroxyacylglutathione hydrolase
MKILAHSGGIAGTNCYLVADETTGKAVLIDAPDHTTLPMLQEAQEQGWDVIGLWLTHGHFDHVADHAVVTGRFPAAKVLIHRDDEPKLIEPRSQFFDLPFKIPPRRADAYLEDGQVLHVGSVSARVIHTPGHSPGHVVFYFPDQEVAIGGDLIIMGGVGRTDLPDSNANDLYASIRKVMKLPPSTRLLGGHGPASTLALEAENNPYVIEAMENRDPVG